MTQLQKDETRIRRALFGLSWRHPFFAIPAARLTLSGTRDDIKTMGVTRDGKLYWCSEWMAGLDSAALRGVLAHEICHLIYRHAGRRGDRDHRLWNIAGDYAINAALKDAKITLPEGGIFPAADHWQDPAEDHYMRLLADMMAEDGDGDGDEDGDGPPAPGAGCGVAEGDEGDADPAPGEGEPDPDVEWAQVAAQAASMAGNGPGAALARIAAPAPARVDWRALLRRGTAQARAAHGRDDQTWARRGRRSTASVMLPGWTSTSARCAVLIDCSSSVSEPELDGAIAETVKVARESGVAVYLVIHNTKIVWQGWIRPGVTRATMPSFAPGGGTDPNRALAAVEGASRRFDYLIHLTDGEMDWPASRPRNVRRALIALVRKPQWGTRPDWADSVDCEVKV